MHLLLWFQKTPSDRGAFIAWHQHLQKASEILACVAADGMSLTKPPVVPGSKENWILGLQRFFLSSPSSHLFKSQAGFASLLRTLLCYARGVLYVALIITHGLKKDAQLKSIFKVIKQAHTNFNSHTIHSDITTQGAESRAVLECREHSSAHSLQNLMKTHHF